MPLEIARAAEVKNDNQAFSGGDNLGGEGVAVREGGDVNAQRNAHIPETPKISGQTVGQIDGTNFSVKQIRATKPRNAQRNTHKREAPKPIGQIANKWFRYELDMRKLKAGGYQVLIRKRLRWSKARDSRTITMRHCANLTDAMVRQLRNGRFTQSIKLAFERGGIGNELIGILNNREGRGRGKRASQLTDIERSFLARLEHGIAAGNRKRRARTARNAQRDADVLHPDVRGTSDGDFAEVPTMPEWRM